MNELIKQLRNAIINESASILQTTHDAFVSKVDRLIGQYTTALSQGQKDTEKDQASHPSVIQDQKAQLSDGLSYFVFQQ